MNSKSKIGSQDSREIFYRAATLVICGLILCIAVETLIARPHNVWHAVALGALILLLVSASFELASRSFKQIQAVNSDLESAVQLKRSEEILTLCMRHTPAAVAMFDKNLCYLSYSDRWLSDYKLEKKALVGRSFYETFPDIKRCQPVWLKYHQQCLSGRVLSAERDTLIAPDGQLLQVRWELRPWRDHDGQIGGLIMFIEDITEKVLSEEKIKAAQARFEAIINNMLDALLITDSNDQISLANPAACRLFEADRGDLIGKNLREFLPDIPNRLCWGDLKESQAITTTGQALPVEYSPALMGEENNQNTIYTIREITYRKEAEANLSQALEALMESNEKLERFSYCCAHDLLEPLRTTHTYVQKIKSDIAKGREITAKSRALTIIEDNTERAQLNIERILRYNQLTDRGRIRETVDLNTVAEEAKATLRDLIVHKEARITYCDLPTISGNLGQIKLLFEHLLSNALIFCETKPDVDIRVDELAQDWQIRIKDNGIGIDEQYRNEIFSPFKRLGKRKDSLGTGIGLAICKKIAENHGGRIWAESTATQGSEFFVLLHKNPRQDADEHRNDD